MEVHLSYTKLWAEQCCELQLHHGIFAPGVAVGNSHTLQHGPHVIVISLLSGVTKANMYLRGMCVHVCMDARLRVLYPVLSPRSSSIGTASMVLSPSELIFFMD